MIRHFLNEDASTYAPHLREFMIDVETGNAVIYTSSIFFAEMDHRAFAELSSAQEFFSDFARSINIVESVPDIMINAGGIRSRTFSYIGSKKASSPPKDRPMSTGDSIFLATALHIKEQLSVTDLVFHTLDEGKNKGSEGKCVPLLGLEDWCSPVDEDDVLYRALSIPRSKPIHNRIK